MEKYLEIIKESSLFYGIKIDDIPSLLSCLSIYKKSYQKNEFVLHKGDIINSIGMVLSGSVHIQKEDYWGNRNIISEITPGELFAETYACLQNTPVNISVVAQENTLIMFMNITQILTTCSSSCQFHIQLIKNLLAIMAQKNLLLSEKIEHLSQRTTRKKLLSYLSSQSQKANSSSFDIPFNRQQLADYFSIDRSAMSNELCKMRDEGLIKFNKNHFVLNYISEDL
ncbi:MAG TPA: Crp/Fnr family transcriptional regulator [Clostridia bacterium]